MIINQVLIYFLLQLIIFIPFYFIWKNDCNKLGKANLAVSLEERFFYFLIFCPIWLIGLII